MHLDHLVGRCLFCGCQTKRYNPSETRVCGCTGSPASNVIRAFGEDTKLFPTIYPIPACPDTEFAPPHPGGRPVADAFAICNPQEGTAEVARGLPVMPYPEVSSVMDHLRCGNSTLYNLGGLARGFAFEPDSIRVCDMSTYFWSNTLKDPRSWAVIKIALAYEVRHLGVWTAGNAGLSLAKLAYAVNRFLPLEDRINVYCYGVKDAFPEVLQQALQRFQAHVAIFDPPEKKVFPPEQALQRLRESLGVKIENEGYWDVSDGWDGVGLYMYRLLARQICTHLEPKPNYIVVPVGTGDLFYGFFLGREDCIARGTIRSDECKLVAALPLGENILENYKFYRLEVPSSEPNAGPNQEPVAPKLATIYTPLLPVMYKAFWESCVIQVTKDEQAWAADLLLPKRPNRQFVAAEPSALVAFAALSRLSKQHLEKERKPVGTAVRLADAQVVVVNTGCGILGPEEYSFLGKHLGRPGVA